MTQNLHQLNTAPAYQRWFVRLLGTCALVPLFFMLPEILTGQFHKIAISTAAVLGVGGVIIFMAMMAITPLVTITGQRWFVPLRWWFGVVFASTVFVDIVLTATTAGLHLKGGILARTVGHTFTIVGVLATLITLVIALTASRKAQRALGRKWKVIQRFTYAVWALIILHMMLLMGFGHGENGILFFGDAQRFYQVLFMSIPLLLMRLPMIRSWWLAQREAHGWTAWKLWALGLPMLGVMVFFWGGLISYEIEQGTQAYTLEPRDE